MRTRAGLLQAGALVFMAAFYGFLLCQAPYTPEHQTLTYNSMMTHMLKGRFDVDPGIIGNEGFLRNGKVYAYWGIFCALLRLPAVLANRSSWDLTVFSCVCAVCLAGFVKIRALLLVCSHSPRIRETTWPATLMLLFILFGGSEIGYLKSSIFQETVFWGFALATLFVYFALTGLVEGHFRERVLVWMAATAGLATMTRVDIGLGLSTAFVLLLLSVTLTGVKKRSLTETFRSRQFLLPLSVLLALLLIVAFVNYERWGSPLTFADFRLYLMNRNYPDRVARLQRYSSFNVRRIPFGLMYYFAPVWVFHGSGGAMLFDQARSRLLDVAELPPSSFLFTDAFSCMLVILLGKTLLRLKDSARSTLPYVLVPVMVGLAIPCCLLLMASSMAYRYRMDFYPLLDFLAFTGLYLSLNDEHAFTRLMRWRRLLTWGVAVSISSSMGAMILYKLSYWGPGEHWLHQGLIGFYVRSAMP
jgi:thiosulfate reductase cytochrome b subunit